MHKRIQQCELLVLARQTSHLDPAKICFQYAQHISCTHALTIVAAYLNWCCCLGCCHRLDSCRRLESPCGLKRDGVGLLFLSLKHTLHVLLKDHRASIGSGRAGRLDRLQEAACKLTDGRILCNA